MHRPNLKAYKAIESYYEVFILLEKQLKVYKVKAKTESKRLLIVLRFKNYLVYIPTKNIVIKTLYVKLYELKNLLISKEVSKPIRIRLLNDVTVIKDGLYQRKGIVRSIKDRQYRFFKAFNP